MIFLKRIYERPAVTDGVRILVDRLWPRGVRRSTANVDMWIKDVGPSDELRKWFAHERDKYPMFKKKYLMELKKSAAFEDMVNLIRSSNDNITLLFSASDARRNNAVVLQQALEREVRKKARMMHRTVLTSILLELIP